MTRVRKLPYIYIKVWPKPPISPVVGLSTSAALSCHFLCCAAGLIFVLWWTTSNFWPFRTEWSQTLKTPGCGSAVAQITVTVGWAPNIGWLKCGWFYSYIWTPSVRLAITPLTIFLNSFPHLIFSVWTGPQLSAISWRFITPGSCVAYICHWLCSGFL